MLDRRRRRVAGLAIHAWHIDEEDLATPIGRVAEPVGAVLESADATGRLRTRPEVRDGAVPSVFGDRSGEGDAPGVRGPAPDPDAEFLIGQLHRLSAICSHDLQLCRTVGWRPDEGEKGAIR